MWGNDDHPTPLDALASAWRATVIASALFLAVVAWRQAPPTPAAGAPDQAQAGAAEPGSALGQIVARAYELRARADSML